MSYIGNRLVHDADSHIMERSDCLDAYLESRLLTRFRDLPFVKAAGGEYDRRVDAAAQAASAAGYHEAADDNIMLRKNHEAMGATLPADRPRALDLLGVSSQLVFTTFCLSNFGLDQGDDMDLCYGAADAHNRMMRDFCSVDKRLLDVAYVPLEDFDRSAALAQTAIKNGAKALMVPSRCPQQHGPSHKGLFPIWAMAQEAGLPVLFHVGGEAPMNPVYKENGLPPVPDFQGGDTNFTSVSYMPIPNDAMQALTTLIIDGVFDAFPNLKWGAIELGANWLPGWMRAMDSAAHAFHRNEERLQKLSAKPSELARRQLRVAPYPHEDVGWIIANSGPEMCLFSTDFPHIEGGRDPLKRFNAALEGQSKDNINGFYADNFIDLMGNGLAAELRRPDLPSFAA